MKTKITFFIVFVLCFVFLISCQNQKTDDALTKEDIDAYNKKQKLECIELYNQSILAIAQNDVSWETLEESLPLEYEISDKEYLQYVSSRMTIFSLYDLFSRCKVPFTHIEKIDETHILIVGKYKSIYDSIPAVYVYLPFYWADTERNAVLSESKEDLENWIPAGETYVVGKVLSSEAFKNIQVGDSIDKMVAIDETLCYQMVQDLSADNCYWRLLTDGILYFEINIQWRQLTESDVVQGVEYMGATIKNMHFYPYGSEDVPGVFALMGDKIPILPIS